MHPRSLAVQPERSEAKSKAGPPTLRLRRWRGYAQSERENNPGCTRVKTAISFVGDAYDLAGQPEEAITPLKQYLSHYPNILGAHLTLAAVYSELGKETEAHTEAAEVLRLNPQFSLEVHKERVPIKDPAMLERHLAALRKAGLK